MRTTSFLAALAAAALMSACAQQTSAQSAPFGPMMGYGYCPGASSAQDPQGWRGPGMMMGGRGMMGGAMMGGGMHGGFDPQRTAAWLDEAKREIGVTDAQEAAWSAYAAAVQADRSAMSTMHAQMMGGAGADGPARLQAHLSFMQARLDSLRQVEAANQALYQLLTPEQRARADRTLWSGCW